MVAKGLTQSGLSAAMTVPESGLPASNQDQKHCYLAAAVRITIMATAERLLALEPSPAVLAQPSSDSTGATSSTAAAVEVDCQPSHRLDHLRVAFHYPASCYLQIPSEHTVAVHLKARHRKLEENSRTKIQI